MLDFRKTIFVAIFLTLLMASLPAGANPPCPKSAENLEEFTWCMAPLADGSGMALRRSGGGAMGSHAQSIMAAMMSGPVVPPQVIPATPYYGIFAGYGGYYDWSLFYLMSRRY